MINIARVRSNFGPFFLDENARRIKKQLEEMVKCGLSEDHAIKIGKEIFNIALSEFGD